MNVSILANYLVDNGVGRQNPITGRLFLCDPPPPIWLMKKYLTHHEFQGQKWKKTLRVFPIFLIAHPLEGGAKYTWHKSPPPPPPILCGQPLKACQINVMLIRGFPLQKNVGKDGRSYHHPPWFWGCWHVIFQIVTSAILCPQCFSIIILQEKMADLKLKKIWGKKHVWNGKD